MKRIFVCVSVLLLCALLCGCGKKSENTTVDISADMPADMPGNMPQGDMPADMPEGMSGRPAGDTGGAARGEGGQKDGAAGGQTPSVRADANDLLGRVESIVGNEATLLLGAYGSDGKLAYGEERATCLLPVGMSIGTGDFSSVTAGTVIFIERNDAETVTAVTLLSR